jgi:hypothetical protein
VVTLWGRAWSRDDRVTDRHTGLLAPGEARHYRLEIGALPDRDAIDAFGTGVRAAAGPVESPA